MREVDVAWSTCPCMTPPQSGQNRCTGLCDQASFPSGLEVTLGFALVGVGMNPCVYLPISQTGKLRPEGSTDLYRHMQLASTLLSFPGIYF